jgi:hypothetical protein
MHQGGIVTVRQKLLSKININFKGESGAAQNLSLNQQVGASITQPSVSPKGKEMRGN